MSTWTTGHEDVLREMRHLGAEAVSDEIFRRFGVRHSAHAVEMHAHRIHVSLRRMHACPECGLLVGHLNRQTGLCPRCSEVQHVEEERAFRDILEREAAEAEEQRLEVSREYAALRQQNMRTRKKFGLASKAERKRAGSL